MDGPLFTSKIWRATLDKTSSKLWKIFSFFVLQNWKFICSVEINSRMLGITAVFPRSLRSRKNIANWFPKKTVTFFGIWANNHFLNYFNKLSKTFDLKCSEKQKVCCTNMKNVRVGLALISDCFQQTSLQVTIFYLLPKLSE